MDIHMDNRGFSEIHAWICYAFSDQGGAPKTAGFSAYLESSGNVEILIDGER